MCVRLDGVEYFLDDHLLINDESNAPRHVGFIVQNAKGLCDALVRIRDQLEWEVELLCEVLMGHDIVNADAQDLCSQLANFRVLIPETTGLDGTARSIVFGIEVENNLLAFVIIELHHIPRSQERGELRSARSCLDTRGRLHDLVKATSTLLWASLGLRCRESF